MGKPETISIYRAHWVFDAPSSQELRAYEKGALAVDSHGMIVGCGEFSAVKKKFPKAKLKDYGDYSIITPGFVDTHVHAPQLEMIGAAGYGLLDWLNNYTFPTEKKFSQISYAKKKWNHFCEELLRCGTTSAAVYATSHTEATKLLMDACHKTGLRAHVGKVLMDRNAPSELLHDAATSLEELEELILGWKKKSFVKPSITVRFAPTSTDELLRGAGKLAQKYSDLVVQTHLGETKEEIQWVQKLFPRSENYTAVYSDVGLIHNKTVLAHGIYLDDREVETISRCQGTVAHCPTSNFFLGSGLLPYLRLKHHGVNVGMGSDVGGGWDLCMTSVARACYETQALQGHFLKPGELLYLSTYAGAKVLCHDEKIGLLESGYRADFLVHDVARKEILKDRMRFAQSPSDILAALIFLGNDSSLKETYIDGKLCFKRSKA